MLSEQEFSDHVHELSHDAYQQCRGPITLEDLTKNEHETSSAEEPVAGTEDDLQPDRPNTRTWRMLTLRTDPPIKVHPLNLCFPMIPDLEMRYIAQSIKREGLLLPIAVMTDPEDGADVLIDGKLRLRCCEMAGVEPRFVHLPEDTDVWAYLISMNVIRYHQPSRAARAMRQALSTPPEDDLPGDELLRLCRQLLAEGAPNLVKMVLEGIGSPVREMEAIVAQRAKDEADRRKWAEFKTVAPVWAALVEDGEMTREEAVAIYRKRQAEAAEQALSLVAPKVLTDLDRHNSLFAALRASNAGTLEESKAFLASLAEDARTMIEELDHLPPPAPRRRNRQKAK